MPLAQYAREVIGFIDATTRVGHAITQERLHARTRDGLEQRCAGNICAPLSCRACREQRSLRLSLTTKDAGSESHVSCLELKLNHLSRMTDSTGLFPACRLQRSQFPREGYCTDDNARAFILTVLLGELGEYP